MKNALSFLKDEETHMKVVRRWIKIQYISEQTHMYLTQVSFLTIS